MTLPSPPDSPTNDETEPSQQRSKRSKMLLRIGALVLFLVACYAVAFQTGILDSLSLESIRTTVQSAGLLGVLIFFAAFAAGNILQLPGNLFLAVAVLVYGPVTGSVVGWVGALGAISASFFIARTIGGQPLAEIKSPFMRKILDQLNSTPLRVMVLLRIVFQSSPQVNYALALSGMRFRDYLFGSALGLIAPVLVVALFVEEIVLRFL